MFLRFLLLSLFSPPFGECLSRPAPLRASTLSASLPFFLSSFLPFFLSSFLLPVLLLHSPGLFGLGTTSAKPALSTCKGIGLFCCQFRPSICFLAAWYPLSEILLAAFSVSGCCWYRPLFRFGACALVSVDVTP